MTAPDNNPEGNAVQSDAWSTAGVPGWQAALIRLARPALLWALGVVTLGVGALLVGIVEAIVPGAGVRMASAMAGMLNAYPSELYFLVGFLFSGQALGSYLDRRRRAG